MKKSAVKDDAGQPLLAKAKLMASQWLGNPEGLSLLGHRENTVYLADSDDKEIVIRLLRSGYNSFRELRSEVSWILHLHRNGVAVAKPLASRTGKYLHRFYLDNKACYANASEFLPDKSFRHTLDNASTRERWRLWFRLGELMANIHHASDTLTSKDDIQRRHWNIEKLVGSAPHWGQFWKSPLLNNSEKKLLIKVRDQARTDMRCAYSQDADYGLIHCDLNVENVLCHRRRKGWHLSAIDFDDGGFGFRVYDLIIPLLGYHESSEYENYRSALFEGYAHKRSMKMPTDRECQLLLMVRALSLLGWVSSRLEDCADPGRPLRSKDRAMKLVAGFLQA